MITKDKKIREIEGQEEIKGPEQTNAVPEEQTTPIVEAPIQERLEGTNSGIQQAMAAEGQELPEDITPEQLMAKTMQDLERANTVTDALRSMVDTGDVEGLAGKKDELVALITMYVRMGQYFDKDTLIFDERYKDIIAEFGLGENVMEPEMVEELETYEGINPDTIQKFTLLRDSLNNDQIADEEKQNILEAAIYFLEKVKSALNERITMVETYAHKLGFEIRTANMKEQLEFIKALFILPKHIFQLLNYNNLVINMGATIAGIMKRMKVEDVQAVLEECGYASTNDVQAKIDYLLEVYSIEGKKTFGEQLLVKCRFALELDKIEKPLYEGLRKKGYLDGDMIP